MTQPLLAWHFIAGTLRDGSPIPPDGVMLEHTGPLQLCRSGLHASVRILNALDYAPGSTICRVECGGEIIHEPDKLVCRERTILWRIDGTDLLRQFARQCALDVIHLWNAPPIVRQYLETGDEKIRANAHTAAHATWDAQTAAQTAARAATWNAQTATRAAAWAVRAVALWHAHVSARDAARDARDAQDAAHAAHAAYDADAARDTARDTAQAAQNSRLEALIITAHEEQK